MSLVRQMLVFFWLQFRTVVVLHVSGIQCGIIWFYVLDFMLVMTTSQAALWRLPIGRVFTPGLPAVQLWSIFVLLCLYRIQQLFYRIRDTVLLIFHEIVCIMSIIVLIGVINELEVNYLFENPSAAVSVSKYFAICACNVSPMAYLGSRSNITGSKQPRCIRLIGFHLRTMKSVT